MNISQRYFLAGILLIGTLRAAETPLPITPQPTTIQTPAAPVVFDQQTEMMLCWQHIEQLDKFIDIIESTLRNEAIKIIRNPHKVKSADTRTQAEAWMLTLVEDIKDLRKKLSTQALTVAALHTYYASLIHTITRAFHALDKKFDATALTKLDAQETEKEIVALIAIMHDVVTKKAPEIVAETRTKLATGMPPHIAALIQSAELKPYLILDALLEKLQLKQDNLACAIRDYGLSKINRTARQFERRFKSFQTTPTMEWVKTVGSLCTVGVVGGYGLPLVGHMFGHFVGDDAQSKLAGAAIATLVLKLGESVATSLWNPTSKLLNSTKAKIYKGWNWVKGEEYKETIDGFDVLREEDCEGRELPPIGIENVLNVILSNVEGALTRLEQGDPAPFQDIQKAFILTGKSGAGKTFAVQQLKIRFAKLNRKLQRKIVYQALTPLDLMKGYLPLLIEMAKQRDVALILWIDELHLTKPMKDGDAVTLYDFLTAEIINKQNLPIWIIGASNEPGRFDNALIRAGRFEIINVPDFTMQDRMSFFAFYAQQEGLTLPEPMLRMIAFLTQGCSPALLMKLILSAKQHGQVLTAEWLFDAILRLVVRTTPGFESLAPTAQQELATYLLGQAMVKMATHTRLPDASPLDPDPVLLVTA